MKSNKLNMSYFSSETYVVGTQKNRLDEIFLFEQPKHMFLLVGNKIIAILH